MKIIKQIVQTSVGTQREEFSGEDAIVDIVFAHYKDTMLANGRAILAMTIWQTATPPEITPRVEPAFDTEGNLLTPGGPGGDLVWHSGEMVGSQPVPM